MDRLRLSVALLIDEPESIEINGLRRALGAKLPGQAPPHLTLVPPVNVAGEDVDRALTIVRQAAASVSGPLSVTVGPAACFAENGVLYLGIGDPPEASPSVAPKGISGGARGGLSVEPGVVDQIGELRERVMRPPLWRHISHSFVPHVTLGTSPSQEILAASIGVLAGFEIPVTFRSASLLRLGVDGVWSSIADCPLGKPILRGRGTFVKEIRLVEHCAPDVAGLFGGATVGTQILEARSGEGLLLGALGFSVETALNAHANHGYVKQLRTRLVGLAVVPEERGFGVGGLLVSEILRYLASVASSYTFCLVDFGHLDAPTTLALSALWKRFGFSDRTSQPPQDRPTGRVSLFVRDFHLDV
jgi:2'-5' RNA ligase/GNAT superfamily N-acetyltransferase